MIDIRNYSPSVLAYMGDAYIELLVRRYLIGNGDVKTSHVNTLAKKFVSAKAQSAAVEALLPFLNAQEEGVYRQGRNAKCGIVPKHADPIDYRRATGMECLFGYLFLTEKTERAEELFVRAYGL